MSGLPPACLCDVPSASEQPRPTDSTGIYLIRSILSVMHQISILALKFWRQWQTEMSGAVWCSLTYRWDEFKPCTVTHGFNFFPPPSLPFGWTVLRKCTSSSICKSIFSCFLLSYFISIDAKGAARHAIPFAVNIMSPQIVPPCSQCRITHSVVEMSARGSQIKPRIKTHWTWLTPDCLPFRINLLTIYKITINWRTFYCKIIRMKIILTLQSSHKLHHLLFPSGTTWLCSSCNLATRADLSYSG